jgi:serine/threonine protein kinase
MQLVTLFPAQSARVPAPDGARCNDAPLLVLPEGTQVRGLKLHYLAAGGMSVAYKGLCPDGRWKFVKEVPKSQSQSVMSLTQEKALLERLSHPGIVQVHDLFEWKDHLYLVQDFIEGGNLEQQISPFPDIYLSEAVVRDWAAQLCDIFEYLHSQQPPIIYRDLKPKNVLRDTRGKLYLVDFGIARAYKEGKEQDTRLLGSVLTASPEHYGGQTDARSDLYTLGATLHYLLTNGQGERVSPFDFPPVRSIHREVTAELEAVIQRCLERQPEKRYQSVAELRRALTGQTVPQPSLPASIALPAAAAGPAPSWPLLLTGLCLGVGLTLLFTRPRTSGSVPTPTSSPESGFVSATPLALFTPVRPVANPVPEFTSTPRPVVVSRPVAKPLPRPPRAVATPRPVVAATPDFPPPPRYPVSTPRLPDPVPIPTRSASPNSVLPSIGSESPILVLQQLGLPWAGSEALRELRPGSARQADWVAGPGGLFRVSVPAGYRVFGGPDDFWLVQLARSNTRLIRFHTLVGVYCDPIQLSEARERQLGSHVLERRTLRISGRTVSALVTTLPRRPTRVEEVLWSNPEPPWTLAVAAGSPPAGFPELQAHLERLLQGWEL